MGFREQLEEQAAQKYKEYEHLVDQIRQLGIRIEGLRRYLDGMAPLMIEEGLTPPTLPPVQVSILTDQPKGGTGFATKGNRSEGMPKRRQRFEQSSQMEAVKAILEETGRLLSADELVSLIWDAQTREERVKAKHSLVSTLSQGVKNGLWARPRPGRFSAPYATTEEVRELLAVR